MRFRIALSIVCVEIVMLSVLVVNNLANFRHSYEHRLSNSAENIGAQFSATAARFLFELDTASLEEYVSQVMSHDELIYAAVYDLDNRLIAAIGSAPDADDFNADNEEHEIIDGVLDYERPVQSNGEPLGLVRLGFSLESMENTLADARNQAILIASIEILLTILVGFFIGHRLTKDLTRVSEVVSEYGEGKIDLNYPETTSVEVGSIVKALQRMVRERRKAEQNTHDNEVFFRSLIEKSVDVIFVIDDEGRVSFAGPSLLQILGISSNDINGRPIGELAADQRSRTLYERILNKPKTDETLEIVLLDAFDKPCFFEVVWQDFRHEPAIKGFVLNCRDVTRRREVERKLRQSEKMEAIGNLTGGVAHDFNNQLAAIMGNLELLDDSTDSRSNKKLISEALAACVRSAELTKSLLSFSRRASLSPVVLDLNTVVRDSSTWIQRTLPANIDIDTSLLAGLWKCRIDPHALENALLNLVINARDAMSKGGKLTFETSNMRIDEEYNKSRQENLPAGRYVMLAISDTGHGIAPELLNRIFEPFYSTKPIGSGSGLGLSSVEGFVRQSGGTIRVYSEVDSGTTFKLFFPAAQLEDSEKANTTQEPGLLTSKGTRILVAEDSSELLTVLTRFLEKAGYDISTATSGDEAFAIYNEDQEIDLLITDIVMPGKIMGTDLARKIRELRPELPIIFMSGYASEATVHGNGLRPEDIRLMKPIRRVDILRAVETAISSAKANIPVS